MTHLVAIDWGTSSFRAWLLNNEGEILCQVKTTQGIRQRNGRSFSNVLAENLAQLNPPEHIAIILSGMVTSQNGWIETPYIPCPVELSALAENLVCHRCTQFGELWFVPGICQYSPNADIIRGEETELIGLDTADNATVVLPGTHSKWVEISKGKIINFTTFMTGELFSAITRHTILAHCNTSSWSEENFLQGVITGAENHKRSILSRLFELRANAILKNNEPYSHSFLSGLLIGMEITDAKKQGYENTVQITGEHALVQLYHKAFTTLKMITTSTTSNTAARGLFRIAKQKGII